MNTGALGLVLFQIVTLSVDYLLELRKQTRRRDWTSFGYTSRFSYNYIYTKTIRHLLQETQANKRSSNRLFLNADQYLPIFLQTTCLNDKHLLGFRGTVIKNIKTNSNKAKTWILSAKHEEQINNICLVSAPDASNSCGVV